MSIENKVPAIRFKGFSRAWEERGMLDCSSAIGDGLHGTPKYTEGSGIHFINGNNLISGSIFITDETKEVKKEEQSKSDQNLGFNTILISINGTIGNLAWYRGEEVMLGKSVAYISLKNCDYSYIYFYLQTKRIDNYFFSNLTGSTIKNLGLKTIRETAVIIPENELEQTQIGSYFQQLDTLIAQHHKKHDKLLSLKKSLLEKMFPKQDTTEPEIRFKGFSGEWELCELGKHSIIKGRLGWKSLKQNEYLDDGPSMIAGRHVTNGVINWNVVDHIPEWRYLESPEIMLKNDDIIFSKDGSLGNPAIIKNLQGFATINSTMMLVRPGKKLVSDFFFQVLKTKRFDDLIKLKVSGSSIPHLFQADMNQFEFDYPAPEEQSEIGKLFKQLDTLISQHKAQLKKLSNIKQACLEKMFV